MRLFKHNGATLHTGRHQRGLLHRAGFVRIEASAAYDEASGTPELVRRLATARVALWTKSDRADQIVKLGWTDRAELKRIRTARYSSSRQMICWVGIALKGEGTHGVMLERNRMQLFREVQLFLDEER